MLRIGFAYAPVGTGNDPTGSLYKQHPLQIIRCYEKLKL